MNGRDAKDLLLGVAAMLAAVLLAAAAGWMLAGAVGAVEVAPILRTD